MWTRASTLPESLREPTALAEGRGRGREVAGILVSISTSSESSDSSSSLAWRLGGLGWCLLGISSRVRGGPRSITSLAVGTRRLHEGLLDICSLVCTSGGGPWVISSSTCDS